ncbi:MAG: hypothetical protein RLP09_30120 [Sandaracinaceae bacterium]
MTTDSSLYTLPTLRLSTGEIVQTLDEVEDHVLASHAAGQIGDADRDAAVSAIRAEGAAVRRDAYALLREEARDLVAALVRVGMIADDADDVERRLEALHNIAVRFASAEIDWDAAGDLVWTYLDGLCPTGRVTELRAIRREVGASAAPWSSERVHPSRLGTRDVGV